MCAHSAFTTESGADINRIYHFYLYSSFDERDALRTAGVSNQAWGAYVAQGRKHTRKQASSVLSLLGGRPTAAVQAALQTCQQRASGELAGPPPPCSGAAYLLCTYELPAGAHLPSTSLSTAASSKENGGSSAGDAQLMFVGSKAFGRPVGTVVELWRFPSAARALTAQQQCAGGSGPLQAWRQSALPSGTVVMQQRVVLLRPTKWSNLQ